MYKACEIICSGLAGAISAILSLQQPNFSAGNFICLINDIINIHMVLGRKKRTPYPENIFRFVCATFKNVMDIFMCSFCLVEAIFLLTDFFYTGVT